MSIARESVALEILRIDGASQELRDAANQWLVAYLRPPSATETKATEMLDAAVHSLAIDTATKTALGRAGISSIRDLTELTSRDVYARTRNIGTGRLRRLRERLAEIGLCFKGERL